MSPTLLILNGTSSAGKSTLAKAFQARCRRDWVNMALDRFFEMFPDDNVNTWDFFEPMSAAYYQTAGLWAGRGYNLVVDTVFERHECLSKALHAFAPYRVYLVGVFCPSEELARREHARGDRRPGLALSQIERVHRYLEYDLRLDSHASPLDENLAQLEALLEREPAAFGRLLARPLQVAS